MLRNRSPCIEHSNSDAVAQGLESEIPFFANLVLCIICSVHFGHCAVRWMPNTRCTAGHSGELQWAVGGLRRVDPGVLKPGYGIV